MQGSAQLEHNYGYDDDKGDYKIITNDHIGYRYEIKSFLGKGSFGTALKCFDHKEGVEVAVKVVKNCAILTRSHSSDLQLLLNLIQMHLEK